MDRPLIYPNELPMVEDILGFAKAALYSIAALSASTIGAIATGVSGLVISATGPASMSVIIGTGSIYEIATVDATAYGTLGTDANLIYKQGFLAAPATLTLTAPGTSGYSQNYLVQAGYADADVGAIVPPYLNSSNPLVPWAGANNLGGSQYTVRQGQLILGLKAGTAAPTGSQTTPAPDAGFVGLWQITVANTTTTITSANWSRMNPDPYAAPWFPNLQSLDGRYVRITTPTTSQTSSSIGTTFYVDAAIGSDTLYDGTSPTIVGTTTHGPFATIQGAISILSNLQAVSGVTIHVAAGTYGAITIAPSNISSWTIIGASAATVTISNPSGDAVYVFGSQVVVSLSNMTLSSGFSGGCCCHCHHGASIVIGGTLTIIIPTAGCGFWCHDSATITTSGAVTVNYSCGGASALCHTQCGPGGGRCQWGNVGAVCTHVASGSPWFTQGWAYCYHAGVIYVSSSICSFSGSLNASSVRHYCHDNGTINTNGGGTSFFPGTVAGTAQNGTTNFN